MYNFKIGVEAYPDKSSISLGDTIWFHINVPIRLVDINTNQTINFGDAKNLGSAVGFETLVEKQYKLHLPYYLILIRIFKQAAQCFDLKKFH